jgi:hypothetical protein
MVSAICPKPTEKQQSPISLQLVKQALSEAVKNTLCDLENDLVGFSPGMWNDLEPEERLSEIYFEKSCENLFENAGLQKIEDQWGSWTDCLWQLLPEEAKREALDMIEKAMQEYPHPIFMNIPTGSVDTEENWDAENGPGHCQNNPLMIRVFWRGGKWVEDD